jgi:hypothetical protein
MNQIEYKENNINESKKKNIDNINVDDKQYVIKDNNIDIIVNDINIVDVYLYRIISNRRKKKNKKVSTSFYMYPDLGVE